jgi:hypothetical protein
VSLDETRERDLLATSRLALAAFLLPGIDAVPPREIKAFKREEPGPGLGTLCRGCPLARQKAAMIGPIERQIEFDKTRRGHASLASTQRYIQGDSAAKRNVIKLI